MANQLSRNALVIYLRNICSLEYMIKNSVDAQEKLNEKLKSLESGLNNSRNGKRRNNYYKPKAPIKENKWLIIFIFLIVALPILFILMRILNNVEGIADLCIVLFIFFLIIFLPFFPISIIGIIVENKKYNKALDKYNKDLNNYNNNVRNLNSRNASLEAQIREYETKISQFKKEKQRFDAILNKNLALYRDLLKRTYSLNIIPSQFRNIYGATYLYEFISTSQLSLEWAVTNCNLEQIKAQLNVIIRKCDDIIRQQQETNSNLYYIQRQNNQLLEEQRNISYNAELTRQYSEISATNSAVSLELQKKQLAYQEIDFWLRRW